MSDGRIKKVLGINRSYLLLAFLILFHIVNNLIILGRDNTPFLWDGGGTISTKTSDTTMSLQTLALISQTKELSHKGYSIR